MANRSYSQQTLKKLFALSGNKCACPTCEEEMIDSKRNVFGEVCHINGLEPKATRYNPKLTPSELNDYENLILLCPNHHTKADADADTYTSEKLKEMKTAHEVQYLTKQYDIDAKTMSVILNHFNQNQTNINTGNGAQINTQSGDITSYQIITNIFDLERIGDLIFEKNFPKINEMIKEVAKTSAMNFISELIKQGKEKLSQ